MKRKIFSTFIIAVMLFFSAISVPYDGIIDSNSAQAVEADKEVQSEEDTTDEEAAETGNMPKLPSIPKLTDEYKIIETYETSWPEFMSYDIQYDKYDVFPNYVVNLSSYSRKVYEEPDTKSTVLDKIRYANKYQVVALVEDEDGDKWYAVVCEDDDKTVIGYVQEEKVSKREFQLDKMNKYLQNVTSFQKLGHIVYVQNYRYENGSPPRMPNGSYYDDFGYRRGQSIGGYYDSTMDGKFRYIPDGTLGIVEQVIEESDTKKDTIVIDDKGIFTDKAEYKELLGDEDEDTSKDKGDDEDEETAIEKYNGESETTAVKLYVPSFGVSLWVEQKYLNEDKDAPDVLNQAVIVDRLNQNIAVFEYKNEAWQVISMSYSSTGKVGEYSLPTPLGYYMAIVKKQKFDYLEDGTTTIVGFAPYAIRFSAGGYLHGVPMSYHIDENGSRTSPGYYVEYLSSIGTVPKSHMCVRNYTSHAEFMYNWVDIGNCTVIVLE